MALRFLFFGDFRFVVPLFIVIFVIYKIETGKNMCLMSD